MPFGEAICPYCNSVVGDRQALVSGELETDYDTLSRHREESAEPQTVDLGVGVPVQHIAGFRPIFYHWCNIAKHQVTLYADNDGRGRVQPQ